MLFLMSMTCTRSPVIQRYQTHCVCSLVDVFCRAVHHIDDQYYDQKQKNVWAPLPADMDFWYRRFAQTHPWVALVHQRVAGFIELDEQGHIDCLYVDPDFQQQGIGAALLQHVIQQAQQQGLTQLSTDASRCARTLFLQHGFTEQNIQVVRRRGVMLANHQMLRTL